MLKLLVLFLFLFTSLYAKTPSYTLFGILPKYDENFKNYDYVNPNAPKGGTLRISSSIAFNSMNPFILRGTPPPYLFFLVYDTLMVGNSDENLVSYGLVAEDYKINGKTITFKIRENAKFSDSKELTTEDILFSLDLLKKEGSPFFKSILSTVKSARIINKYVIEFTMVDDSHEDSILTFVNFLPILPKHFWEGKDFSSSSKLIPVGSGAYKVKKFDTDSQIVYELNNNYWAKDLPVRKGMFNFKNIEVIVYRDMNTARKAVLNGHINYFRENSAKQWNVFWNKENLQKNLIKESIKTHYILPYQAFSFNLRKPIFQDIRVRKAIAYAYDFETLDKQSFHGLYVRLNSTFSNSEFDSSMYNITNRELEILNKYKNLLPKEVFYENFQPNIFSISGLIYADKLLKEAGYEIKDGVRINTKNGEQLKFSILTYDKNMFASYALFIKNLKRLGIIVNVDVVDTNRYEYMINNRNFDMITNHYRIGYPPGSEQEKFWHSKYADVISSQNYTGVKSEVLDDLTSRLSKAQSIDEITTLARALDRVIMWQYYTIPQYYTNSDNIIYDNKLTRYNVEPYIVNDIFSWWIRNE